MNVYWAERLWRLNEWLGGLWLLLTASMIVSFWFAQFMERKKGQLQVEYKIRTPLTESDVSRLKQQASNSWSKWKKIHSLLALAHRAPTESTDAIKKALTSKNRDIRYYALVAAAAAGTRTSALLLIGALEKKILSGFRIASLLESAPESSVPVLIEAANHPDPLVRTWMIRLLGVRKQTPLTESVIKKCSDPDAEVRAAAYQYLGIKNAPPHTIAEGLKDPAWFVRAQACRALAKNNGRTYAAEFIRLMIHDPSTVVKIAAEQALLNHIQDVLPAIQNCLQEGPRLSKRICVQALVDSGQVAVILSRALSSEKDVSKPAVSLLEAMIKTNIFFGLKHQVDRFQPESRDRLIRIIASFDSQLAEKIQTQKKGPQP